MAKASTGCKNSNKSRFILFRVVIKKPSRFPVRA
jgi:hypothetical protein